MSPSGLTPEQLARQTIDAQLRAAGWLVHGRDDANLHAGRGVAVREFKLERFAPATAQKNVNLQTLTEIAVPLPPEAEILRVVESVDAELERGRRVALDSSRAVQCAARLRQPILKWAFDGRLVDQDVQPLSATADAREPSRAASICPQTHFTP